jgi:choline dehydrogenase-like flavoprotein
MADVVVLGAGLGGTLMAYELVPQLRAGDTVTLISEGSRYHFVPSNPWVAIGWRQRAEIEIDLEQVMRRKGIRLLPQGAARIHPEENRVEMTDGSSVPYDYLVIATGPTWPSTRSRDSVHRPIRSRSAMSTTPSMRGRRSRHSARRRARSSSARRPVPPASARPMNSPISWIRN